MEKTIIRKANFTDAVALAMIQVDNYRASYADFYPENYLDQFTYEEQTQDWQDLIQDLGNKIMLLAEKSEHQPAGYVLLEADPECYKGYDAEIIALHVLKPYRKTGVGKALLAEGISQLIQRKCKSAMLWTIDKNPVRAWYDALSGQLIDTKSYDMDGWIINEVAYGWPVIVDLYNETK